MNIGQTRRAVGHAVKPMGVFVIGAPQVWAALVGKQLCISAIRHLQANSLHFGLQGVAFLWDASATQTILGGARSRRYRAYSVKGILQMQYFSGQSAREEP